MCVCVCVCVCVCGTGIMCATHQHTEIVKNLLNGYKEGAKAKYLGIVCKVSPTLKDFLGCAIASFKFLFIDNATHQ